MRTPFVSEQRLRWVRFASLCASFKRLFHSAEGAHGMRMGSRDGEEGRGSKATDWSACSWVARKSAKSRSLSPATAFELPLLHASPKLLSLAAQLVLDVAEPLQDHQRLASRRAHLFGHFESEISELIQRLIRSQRPHATLLQTFETHMSDFGKSEYDTANTHGSIAVFHTIVPLLLGI
ncbi:hypothetical protein L596_029460 [Steinernema carpocapsae]|uniref:Uncharacterized protein n=1 Tax=Steinernema carpocapsae TaxID=34508 RepID=A0A4U5LUQ9_STECR|nr:hypothetical protein L596_029460 [Steinernema carpocapsae]